MNEIKLKVALDKDGPAKKETNFPVKEDKKAVKRRPGGQLGNKNAEKWSEKKALEVGRGLIEWLNRPGTDYLFMQEYLISIGLYRDVIEYLSKKYISFCELIDRAKEITELKLLKHGMSGELQTLLVKFYLINNYGDRYQDKKTIDNTGDSKPAKTIINLVNATKVEK